MFKQLAKNEKGLTLIELLVGIVILGIVAAIAVPSVGGLIDNTKKDAHVANAQQMINAAKVAVAADKEARPTGDDTTYLSLAYLETEGYLEDVNSPDGAYVKGDAAVTSDSPGNSTSFVEVTRSGNNYTYSVQLYGSERNISLTAEADLDRDVVADNADQ